MNNILGFRQYLKSQNSYNDLQHIIIDRDKYFPIKDGFVTIIALCGENPRSFLDENDLMKKVAFYDLKGVVESLLEGFGITDYKIENKNLDYFSTGLSAVITARGQEIAELGKISKKVCKNFDITEDIFFAQIKVDALCANRKTEYRFTPVPRYPSVLRDIALVVKKDISAGLAMDIIKKTAGTMAVKTELFDVYTGDQVQEGCKSLAFSIEYQSHDATLTEEQVNSVHSKVQNELIARLNASLR